ncbi:hypothetical protein BC827DRAFT_1154192 [Russula dissimulans]|nr:hypothetical protein BC827DRAFT_1154192 [Russula dissimulans]
MGNPAALVSLLLLPSLLVAQICAPNCTYTWGWICQLLRPKCVYGRGVPDGNVLRGSIFDRVGENWIEYGLSCPRSFFDCIRYQLLLNGRNPLNDSIKAFTVGGRNALLTSRLLSQAPRQSRVSSRRSYFFKLLHSYRNHRFSHHSYCLRHSNVDAIAGGAVGSVMAVSIAVLAVFYLRRRGPKEPSHATAAIDSSQLPCIGEAGQSLTDDGAIAPSSSTAPIRLYDPNDPTTYPTYQPSAETLAPPSQVPISPYTGTGNTLVNTQATRSPSDVRMPSSGRSTESAMSMLYILSSIVATLSTLLRPQHKHITQGVARIRVGLGDLWYHHNGNYRRRLIQGARREIVMCGIGKYAMALTWKAAVFGLEPYEESSDLVSVQVDEPPPFTRSPSGMNPPSTQNTRIPKKPLLSRKPVRRTSIENPPHTTSSPNSPSDQPFAKDSPSEPLHSPGHISREPSSDTLSSNPNRSIIPEPLRQLPSWYRTETELAAATTRQFRGRPSSVFSPSFPPMSTEPAPTASPSRPPSGTPLPTPSSSQTRIPDPSGKARTRKLSNTTPDNVDLLDASDPHGTNWHHESPYDGLGLNGDRNPASPDVPDARVPPRNRSHASTLGAGTNHRTNTPSPLSQSASAIHLPPAEPDPPTLTRKLTKQRKPFNGIFGSGFSPAPAPASAPDTASVTPSLTPSTQTITNRLFRRQSMFKSASTTSIPQTISNASIGPDKRQKHSSLLGRFARRFSIMRRAVPAHSRRASVDTTNELSRGDRRSLQTSTTTRPPSLANPMSPVSPSENRQSARVFPPQAGTTPSPDPTPLGTPEDGGLLGGEHIPGGNRDSISSLQVSYSIGRLTVVNPDAPSSTETSPVNQSQPLPSIKTALAPIQMPSPSVDKPLPPPAPPSSPAFLDVPKFESLSSLIPAHSEYATPTRAPAPPAPVPAPMTRANSGEGHKVQSTFPSSQPVPIPRAVSKGEKRAPRSSPTSATPAPSASLSPPPTGPTTSRVSVSAPPAIDDSPLSRASIIANPPTPYVEPTRINNLPVSVQIPAPPPTQVSVPSPVISHIISSPEHPISNESHTPPLRSSVPTTNQGTRFPKSNSSVRSRETETFQLVRSPSAGAMQSTGQSITVAGEQWDIVGRGAPRSRTKKEKEDARRSNVEPERRESRRQDRTVEKVPVPASSSKSESRKSRTKDSSSGHRRSSHTEGHDQVRHDQMRRSPTVPSSRANGTLSPKPTPERSLSQLQGRRPTSELTSAADMNALRAREVWEMDRLWKGRSVAYGLEGPQVVYAQSIADVGSTTSVNGLSNGSAHTSYKLQQGFPFPTTTTTTSGVYSPHALPSSPPLPPLHAPQSFARSMQGALYEFPSGVRSYPDLANIPSIGSPDSTPSLTPRNPLPAPPRQSTYRPSPVPASFVERGDNTTAEYWSKYAGVSVVSPTS